ncbi:MAG: hypothetical protein QXH30_01000 [Candidatus Bilamarchaeaceae archaeon]
MAKAKMLPNDLLELFDFAAANPLAAPLMKNPAQAVAPILLLQLANQSQRGMDRMFQSWYERSRKASQQKHSEEKKTIFTEESKQVQDVQRISFNLVYYNPVLNETQVIPEEISACISDYSGKQKRSLEGEVLAGAQAAMAVDLSAGVKSTYPIYMNIALPLALGKIDAVKLEEALKKIEIETPKPFGGGAAILIRPEVFDRLEHKLREDGLKQEIIAVEAIKCIEHSRQGMLKQMDSIIASFEKVIEELEDTEKPMGKVVKVLPPLSAQRYSLLLKKKKKIAETLVVDMLIADLEFLTIVRKRMRKMSIRELIETLKRLRRLQGLAVIGTSKQI